MVGGVLVVLWVVSCLVIVLLARRLPPGLLRYAARSIPRPTLLAAWQTDPALLLRLLGDRTGRTSLS